MHACVMLIVRYIRELSDRDSVEYFVILSLIFSERLATQSLQSWGGRAARRGEGRGGGRAGWAAG